MLSAAGQHEMVLLRPGGSTRSSGLRESGSRADRTRELHPGRETLRGLRDTATARGCLTAPIARERTVKAGRHPLHPLRALRALAILLLAGALATAASHAGVYRVTCKGIHKLSSSTTGDSCAESGKLDDAHGRFLPSFSEAHADLGHGVLAATAGGGAIRDVGYDGREATSVIIERFRLNGAWSGQMPVEITMTLDYRFGGDGESRLGAMLRSSASDAIRGEHQAAVWVHYTGLGGAVVLGGQTRGRFEQPAEGSIASGNTVELKVIQRVDAAAPSLEIRADLIAYALPNLGLFEESLTSLVQARGEIELTAPCPFHVEAMPDAIALTTGPMIAWQARTASEDARGPDFRC